MKKKIVALKENKIFRTKENFEDEDQKKLIMIREGKGGELSAEDNKALKSRKWIEEKSETHFLITKGEEYRPVKAELVT